MAKKSHLGRGLDALLTKKKPTNSSSTANGSDEAETDASEQVRFEDLKKQDRLQLLPVEFMQRGKYQPRRDMTEEGLEELANSIKTQGVIQPIVVRTIAKNKYEIIAGERRWRASQRAGLSEIPAIIREVPDEAAIAMALVENIQREDLNAIDEAFALRRLMDEFELTHQQTADAVGKSRTTITNLLRLLNLNEDTRILVERGDLEMGHARALLALTGEDQSQTARVIVSKGLTVRETEKLIRKTLNPVEKKHIKPDADISRLEQRLSEHLSAPIQLKHGAKGKGELKISYSSLDELDGILKHLGLSQE